MGDKGRAFTKMEKAAGLSGRTSIPTGEFGPDRVVWTSDSMRINAHAVVYVGDSSSAPPGFEDIPEVRLAISAGKRGPLTLYLTNLRLDELDVLEAVVTEAFALARSPIEERRRRYAKRYAEGGEPPVSSYREKPRVLHRKDITKEAEHDLLLESGDPDAPAEGDAGS